MLETLYAQLRFAASVVFGLPFSQRSLDRLIEALPGGAGKVNFRSKAPAAAEFTVPQGEFDVRDLLRSVLDDAPFELEPEDEVWVKRRESWIPPVEGAAQHDESAAQHDEN